MEHTDLPEDKYRAGFKILDRYQHEWERIHSKTDYSLSSVGLILDKIEELDNSATRRLKSLDELNNCCKSLATLGHQISDIKNDLLQLENSIPFIEDILIELKNHQEHEDFYIMKSQMDAKYQLDLKMMVDVSTERKEKLKLDHNKRIETYEQKQLQELDERRLILEKAFEEEKQRYLNEKVNGNP